jgi:hypothetical protein
MSSIARFMTTYPDIVFETGSLTSNLSDHPQKVKGLIGITLGA